MNAEKHAKNITDIIVKIIKINFSSKYFLNVSSKNIKPPDKFLPKIWVDKYKEVL